jgi:hypothetical protein
LAGNDGDEHDDDVFKRASVGVRERERERERDADELKQFERNTRVANSAK